MDTIFVILLDSTFIFLFLLTIDMVMGMWRDFELIYWLDLQLFRLKIKLRPSIITSTSITLLDNHHRDLAFEKFGLGRYITEMNIKPCDVDPMFGELYVFNFPTETYTVVKVINSSPELDGSFKPYYIRVQNHIHSAHQAVAWTFGMTTFDYYPQIET
jgi:hypothetical protein